MNIGLIGLGAMGRMHFQCWRRSRAGRLVAIGDRNPRTLAGESIHAAIDVSAGHVPAEVMTTDIVTPNRM